MTVRKLSSSEKVFFSVIINAVLVGAIFGLKLLGLSTNSIFLIIATIVSLEIVYLAIFIQISVNKNAQGLDKVEKYIDNIRENEEKTQTSLLYIGHQMKLIQHELDILRKSHIFKTSGNGHSAKLQA